MPITVPQPLIGLLAQQRLRLVQVWRVTRTDGQVFRFTNHNATLAFNGHDYSPSGGFNPSDIRREAGAREITRQFDGAIVSGKFTVDDLRSGRFDEAQVDEYDVDWRFPWAGGATGFRHSRYWIDKFRFDGERWRADLTGWGRWLRAQSGDNFGRKCIWKKLGLNFGVVGKAGCKVDLAPFTYTPASVAVVTSRKSFSVAAGVITGSLGAEFFTDGEILWLTGANAGFRNEISKHPDSGSGAYTFDTYIEQPFDIQVGDTLTVVAGCDREHDTCFTKFGNLVNHRASKFMPDAQTLMKVHSQ